MKHEAPPGMHPESDAGVGVWKPTDDAVSWRGRIPWLFVVIVLAPTLVASLYYLFIAAPLYVSEAQFVVHTRNQGQQSSIGNMLQSVGVSLGEQSETDAYEVQGYMVSRDAADQLMRFHHLRDILSRPEGDFLMRFPRPFEGNSFESLFKNYKRFVTADLDTQTGISVLRVSAFRASDAHETAQALLDGSENLVNRLNDRAMADAVAQAQRQADEAQMRVLEVQSELTTFRNRERLVDPDKSSVAGIDLVSKLEEQAASLSAERAGLAATSPDSPQLPILDRRIVAFRAQIELERSRMAGESDSLAPKVSEYERLLLERTVATNTLEAAVSGLETARLDARRQQLFLERVVNPNQPDKAMQPHRWRMILIVFISSLVAFAIVSLGLAGLREHRQL